MEGTELDVTCAARNSGTAAAGPSTTRFYLTTATASAQKVPADIRLHGTEGWYGGDASTLSMLKLLCNYLSPPASFTHESALASIEAQLSATVGASALEQVAASPLAADAVEAQRLAATGVVQESPGTRWPR